MLRSLSFPLCVFLFLFLGVRYNYSVSWGHSQDTSSSGQSASAASKLSISIYSYSTSTGYLQLIFSVSSLGTAFCSTACPSYYSRYVLLPSTGYLHASHCLKSFASLRRCFDGPLLLHLARFLPLPACLFFRLCLPPHPSASLLPSLPAGHMGK